MEYLPLFLDIKHKPCLVIGGGDIALRKTQSLIRSQAIVKVIAPNINAELKLLVESNGGECIYREFENGDVEGYALIIAATDIDTVNKQIYDVTKNTNALVNVVDNPKISNFIMPAVIDRDPLVVAISSTGKAPVLARIIRAKIETLLPANYGRLASLAGSFRDRVKEKIRSGAERLRFWEKVFDGVAAERALIGNFEDAEKLIEKQLSDFGSGSLTGEVFLVGAGPGDPDLLTFRALRLMQNTDVVLYDRLVSDSVMDLVRKDADRIYVGKKRSEHAVQQTDINQLLVDLAKEGKRVLRLKGGDPFIFGRGGEEIELLAEHNIPFQVVPGITAASGCAAYSGIPLTHRDYAQSVRFITGHLKNDSTNINFSELTDPHQTLVFYMGLVGLPVICQQLIANGRSTSTPAALIEKGTTNEQRVLTGTISTLPDLVLQQEMRAPTLLIIGDVVQLHEKLKWFNP
ncbi:MAG: siroheme synthase CysG [Cellvibrionaceae bacterium]